MNKRHTHYYASSENAPVVHPVADFVHKNKKEVITAGVLVVCVLLAFSGYLIYTTVKRAEVDSAQNTFAQSHTYHVKQGEALTLDSSKEEQGNPAMKNGVPAQAVNPFDWNGTLQATLLDSYIYDSPAAAGMAQMPSLDGASTDEATHASPSDKAGYKFLVCDLQLKNINAKGTMTAKELPFLGDDAQYAYNSSLYSVGSSDPNAKEQGSYRLPDLAEGLIQNAPPQWLYVYTLKPHEEKTLKLGYFVPANLPSDKYVLKIGKDGASVQYLIACTPSIESTQK